MRMRDGVFAAAVESLQTPGSVRTLTFISQYIGVFIALAALVILCGWIFGIPGLQTPFPGAIPMKANAAVCFIFSGIALWLLRTASTVSPAQKLQRYLGYFLASLTAVIGLLVLLEYGFNWDTGLGQLLAREAAVSPGTFYPGRMAPFAALNFLVTGLSLLMLDVKSGRRHHPSSYLMIIVALTSLTALMGYIYGAHEFIGVPPYTPLALDATVGFLLLFVGVLLARPTVATSALLAGNYPGSRIMTFLIPGFAVLVILTGWLRLQGESRGYYSTELGVALFSLINIAVATTLIFMASMRLYTAEQRRRRAELEIRELNANLEQQVTERTGELRKSEEKYRLLFENATEGIFQSTPGGRYISVNPAFARIGGFDSPDEMINSVADIQKEMYVHPEDRSRLIGLLAGSDAVNGFEFEIKQRDGAKRWVSINVRAVRDAAGKINYLEGTLVDITERKQAEESLMLSEARHRELFEHMASSVAVYEAAENGEDFIIRDLNRPAEVLEKVRRGDAIGRSVVDIFPGVVDFGLFDVFKRVWSTGIPEHHPVTQYKDSRITGWRENYVYKLPSGEIVAIYDDVTGRKLNEEALIKSESKYRSLVETAGAGVASIDLDGNLTFANQSLLEVLGYSENEVIGRNFFDFLHPGDRQNVTEIFMKGMSDPHYKPKLEFRILRRDGATIWFYTAPTLTSILGVLTGASAIMTNITERKQAEQALRESEEKFRNVFDHSSIGKSITSFDGTVHPNQALADMLGYSPDELANVKWPEVSYPDDIEETRKQLELLESGEKDSVRFIKRYLKKDGSIVWGDVNTVLQRDRDGHPLYYITGVVDITERKKAEEDIQSFAIFLNNMVEQSPVATWISDDKGTLMKVNRALCELLQATQEELVGKYNIFNDNIVQEQGHMPLVRNVFEKGEVARFELYYDSSLLKGLPLVKTTALILDVTIFPIRDSGGRITNTAIQQVDLTERKKAEQHLMEKTLELERSNTDLERFAYVASHDLQEPLRTISSYLQLLERRYKERLDEKGLQYMDFTVSAANRLQNMISGLLEYSRVETRGQPFGPVNCETVLRQTLENLHQAIDESTTQITYSPLPTVQADRGQLLRLFQNLLSNSIRYRGQGPPRIHISAEKQKEEWVFAVQDNGIGIDPEYKDQIFVIFQSLHGRDVPGIGLGLSVAKRIVERHGGRIWVESRPGEGATFYFTIPVQGGNNK